MQFEKITRPQRTYQEVLKQVSSQISAGKLRPGERLMGEREMATELGVSRTTWREALRTMELLGIVEIKAGGGSFIRDVQLSEVISPLLLALSVEPVRIDELWETRITLEVECAGLAAIRATEMDLNRIAEALREMLAQGQNIEAYAKADMNFHNCLVQAAQNKMMKRLLQTYTSHILELIKETGPLRFRHDAGGRETIQEHVAIYETIVSKDVDRAKALMRKHLEDSRAESQNLKRPVMNPI